MKTSMKFLFATLGMLTLSSTAMADDFVFVEQSEIKTAVLDVDLTASDDYHMEGTANLTSLGLSNKDQVLLYSFKIVTPLNTQSQHELTEFGCQPGTLVIKAPAGQTDAVSIACTIPRAYGPAAGALAESFDARLLIQFKQ